MSYHHNKGGRKRYHRDRGEGEVDLSRYISSLTGNNFLRLCSDDYDDRRLVETPDDRLKAAIISYGEVVRTLEAYSSPM